MAVGGPERLCKLRNVPHASYIYGLTPQSLSSKLCPHPFRVKSQQLLMIVSDLKFFKCFRECCNKKGLSLLQDQVHQTTNTLLHSLRSVPEPCGQHMAIFRTSSGQESKLFNTFPAQHLHTQHKSHIFWFLFYCKVQLTWEKNSWKP